MKLLSCFMATLAGLAAVKANMSYVTMWETSTCTETAWSTKVQMITLYNTVTSVYEKDYTTTEVQYSTIEKPYTITQVVVSTEAIPYTTTQVIEKAYTVVSTESVPYTTTEIVQKPYTTTEIDVSTSVEVLTTTETVYSSFAEEFTTTITKLSISTITIQQPGSVVTQSCAPTTVIQITTYTAPPVVSVTPTTSLSGLVPCPSRTINPTYTTSTPLPSDYLWGCPPGSLCKPPQAGCNFEADLPGPEYYCSPDECMEAETPPPLTQLLAESYCDYPPFDSYFNINPEVFGLNYSIFAIYGQAGACPPSSVTPVSQICDGQPQAPVSQISDGQPQAPQCTVTPVSEISDGQPQAPTTTVVAVSTISDHQPQATITTVARLMPRLEDSFLAVQPCYPECNAAAVWGEYVGLEYNKLCVGTAAFQVALSSYVACSSANPHGSAESLVTQLNRFLDYCRTATPTSATAPPVVQSTHSVTLPTSTTSATSSPSTTVPATSSPPLPNTTSSTSPTPSPTSSTPPPTSSTPPPTSSTPPPTSSTPPSTTLNSSTPPPSTPASSGPVSSHTTSGAVSGHSPSPTFLVAILLFALCWL